MEIKQATEMVVQDLENDYKALSQTLKTTNKTTSIYRIVKHECDIMLDTLNYLKSRLNNQS